MTMTATVDATGPAPADAPGTSPWRSLALAMGGFAIGTTEFVTMGCSADRRRRRRLDPDAGHVISAYALGVVVGAPVLAFFGAKWPRRGLLVALMAAYAVFNAASALADSFELLMVARFLDGLPHGAYFGVASLVAASMAPPGRKGRAVALVMLGLSVANVSACPPPPGWASSLGWRAAYWAVAGLALVTVALVLAFVPSLPGRPRGDRAPRAARVRASRRCG